MNDSFCSMFDSRLFRRQYSSDAMREVWSDKNMFQTMLDAEAALARAEAAVGIIPAEAAAVITAQARAELYDLDTVGQRIFDQAHPFMAVVEALAEKCGGEAGGFVHWGVTTQDMTDTAFVLQIRAALDLVQQRLEKFRTALERRARENAGLLCMGRTHGQQAVPITMGLRFANHVQEIDRLLERLVQLRPRVLVAQLSGAAGTLASLPAQGPEVRQGFASELRLGQLGAGWHTMRDGFAEAAAWLAMVAGAGERFARNVIAMQQTELDELAEPWHHGKIGSSTMPHKRNPMYAEIAAGLAMTARSATSIFPALMVQTFERDMAAWYAEWPCMSTAFLAVDGMLVTLEHVADGLVFNEQAIRANLDRLGGLALSELIMLELARHLGRQEAHQVVYDCSMEAIRANRPFLEVLKQAEPLRQHFDAAELERLLAPANYAGYSRRFQDDALNHHQGDR